MTERLKPKPTPEIKRKFIELSDRWREYTDFLSSPTRRRGHEAYLEVVAMGKDAIPLILRDLKERGGDWYQALAEITGEHPISPEAQGDVGKMNAAWLEWGKKNDYV